MCAAGATHVHIKIFLACSEFKILYFNLQLCLEPQNLTSFNYSIMLEPSAQEFHPIMNGSKNLFVKEVLSVLVHSNALKRLPKTRSSLKYVLRTMRVPLMLD